jgi:hypothetical protein
MTNEVRCLSIDLRPVEICQSAQTIKVTNMIVNRRFDYSFDLGGQPLSPYLCDFLIRRTPNMTSATIVSYCYAFSRLLDCFNKTGFRWLNAEAFSAFIKWLKETRSIRTQEAFAEDTRRGYANFVLRFMESLANAGAISPGEVETARIRHQKMSRGNSERRFERLRISAVLPEEYVRLIRAIRMEYEECKAYLADTCNGDSQVATIFPLLPFTLLLGAKKAVRSAEFNHLKVGDLQGNRLMLNPPNKNSSEIWLEPELLEALTLAENFMLSDRAARKSDDPLLTILLDDGPRAGKPVRFDTMLLRNLLKKFYSKYFNLLDPDGMPSLYSTAAEDESDLVPFRLPFSAYRSAAITDMARHERNPEAVRIFARLESYDTALIYYIREVHRQWLQNVTLALSPSAELLRIALNNKIANPQEESAARSAGASVPGGHCGPAVDGDRSCVRSTDCRLCSFFRIHVSKRRYFVQEMEETLAEADKLQNEDGLLRDAQNLRQFAALNKAIIDRIDDHIAARY